MPNRMLRERALRSRRLGAVSAEAEALYYRLMLVADDYGRYWGEVDLIQSACYPRGERLVGGALDELVQINLVHLYADEGETYLVFQTWDQSVRAKESRFPQPPTDDDDCLPSAPVVEDVVVDVKNLHGSASPSRDDVENLCTLFADLIEKNGVKRPAVTETWRREMRLLIDRDGYAPEVIERVIRFVTADDFERSNVLGVPKLRKRFAALKLKAERAGYVTPITQAERTYFQAQDPNPEELAEFAAAVEADSWQARKDLA